MSSRRGAFKVHHQHPRQITEEAIRSDADAVMLVGLHDPHDEHIAQVARGAGHPVAYYLDNDLFESHRSGAQPPEGDPATPTYPSLVRLITEVDAVWVSDESLTRSAHAYNRRIVPYTGCVPPESLPDHPPRREPGRPVTIGYIGGDLRDEEVGFLWDALERISDEFGAGVEFEFWGVDIAELPRLDVPVRTQPAPSNSFEYLSRLRESRIDILLAPLPDRSPGRSGAAPPPYYGVAVAGALGIFSDVPRYSSLPGGETCLKAANSVAGWIETLRRAITMPADDFDRMRSACIAHVREAHTSSALVDQYEAAWRASEFHQLTRNRRGRDDRPCVAYFLHSPYIAGAEIQLWRRLRLMPSYGIAPVVILPESARYAEATHQVREELSRLGARLAFAQYIIFTEPKTPQEYSSREELDSVLALLRELNPALIHSTTFIPSVGQACQELGIPHIASLYAIDDQFVPPPDSKPYYQTHCDIVQSDSIRYARQWRELLGVEFYCARNHVPESLFDLGRRRTTPPPALLDIAGEPPPSRPTRIILLGALQPRKGQLAAIAAVGTLRREGIPLEFGIYGYTQFYPDYLRACEERIAEDQTQDTVTFHGFDKDVAPALEGADILLCSSTFESFPTSISEAMAAGVLVVTTPAGGISELIVDNVSGILCRGFSDLDILEGLRRAVRLSAEERARIVAQARKVALEEFHPHRTANDLFAAYTKAIRTRRASAPAGTVEVEQVVAVEHVATVVHQSPVEPVPLVVGRRRTPFYLLRRLARKTDTLLLRLLKISPHQGTRPGQAPAPANHDCAAYSEQRPSGGVSVPHPPHSMRGPHWFGRAYCRLRRFARQVDATLRGA